MFTFDSVPWYSRTADHLRSAPVVLQRIIRYTAGLAGKYFVPVLSRGQLRLHSGSFWLRSLPTEKKAIQIVGSLTFQWKRAMELRLTWLYCFLLNEYLVYCNLFIQLSIIPHKIWYEFMWKVIAIFTFHYSPVFTPIPPRCRNNTVWRQCQRTSNVVGRGGRGHRRGTRASGSGGRRGHQAVSHNLLCLNYTVHRQLIAQ